MGVGMAMGQTIAGAMQPAPAIVAPPPLPQKQFFVAVNGQQQGPFDMTQLQQQIAGGGVKRDTLVWSQGMANWSAADKVAELQALFAAAPPPLPPR